MFLKVQRGEGSYAINIPEGNKVLQTIDRKLDKQYLPSVSRMSTILLI